MVTTIRIQHLKFKISILLQCIINIKLEQQPVNGNDRNKTFYLNFCHSLEVYSTWSSLSDTAVIEIPKNVYVQDENGDNVLWGNSTTPDKQNGYVNAGGFSNPQVSSLPLIMRGDKITIHAGYSYISQVKPDGSLAYATKTNKIFKGFVSSLEMKSTLKIHCEDNMWMLKQTTVDNITYSTGRNDISDVLDDIVSKVNSVFPNVNISNDTDQFSLCIDGFSTGNETAADVLNRLKKSLPSLAFYFRDKVLRGGGIVYYPGDQNSTGTDVNGKPTYNTFNFQKNIISDELHYSLKADVNVAAVCYSINSAEGKNATTNKMGGTQLFTTRFQATVGDDMPSGSTDAANNFEYYNFYFKNLPDTGALQTQGQTYLNRYQYDGFRGRFTTFGLPFIKHGNIITITDTILPERNGNYMVKGVHYSFGIDSGLRQEIELHFRTDGLNDAQLGQGM
jgi:hypothetical protein